MFVDLANLYNCRFFLPDVIRQVQCRMVNVYRHKDKRLMDKTNRCIVLKDKVLTLYLCVFIFMTFLLSHFLYKTRTFFGQTTQNL